MITNVNKTLALSGLLIAMGMAGCGGSSDADSTGTLSISMTDAPVENVREVHVSFSGVTVKPQNGEEIEFVFDPAEEMDLLLLTGGTTDVLLPSTGMPAGAYNWIRLAVNTVPNVRDSYVIFNDDTERELDIPSGMQTGLKLVSGFTVTQNQATNMVIDWDLRKALVQPMGRQDLFLRPALRVTDMAVYGTLSGTVDAALVTDSTDNPCTNDLAADTGNAVYLYEGTGATMDDIGSADEPFATATVRQDDAGNYVYAFHYLSEGDYTAAFTCQASGDNADVDETGDTEIAFGATGSNH